MPNNKYNRRYTPYNHYFDKFSFLNNPDYWTDSLSDNKKHKVTNKPQLSSSSSSSLLSNESIVNNDQQDYDSITTEEGELTSNSSEEQDDPNDSDYIPSDNKDDPIANVQPIWPMDNNEIPENIPENHKVQPDHPMMSECITGPDGRYMLFITLDNPHLTIVYNRSPRLPLTWVFDFEFIPWNRLLSIQDVNLTTTSLLSEELNTDSSGASVVVIHQETNDVVRHKIKLNFIQQNQTKIVYLNHVINSKLTFQRAI
jgi:hypothetical protein